MIRPADPRDAAGIARVHVRSWQETYPGLISQDYLDALDVRARTERWNRALAAGRETVFVAERGGEIVGFSSGGPPQQPELGYASELYALYLMRSSQGSGIGRQLFERFADSMRQRGHENLYCLVVRGNPTAAFYRHVGGEQREEKAIEIGGRLITEDLFLWPLAFVRATK